MNLQPIAGVPSQPSLWEQANAPLVYPEEIQQTAKRISSSPRAPLMGALAPVATWLGQEPSVPLGQAMVGESPLHAALRTYGEGTAQSTRNLLSTFSSPVGLAMAAGGAVTKGLSAFNLLRSARMAHRASQAAGVGFGAQGVQTAIPGYQQVYRDISRGNFPNPEAVEQALGGTAQALFGATPVAEPIVAGIKRTGRAIKTIPAKAKILNLPPKEVLEIVGPKIQTLVTRAAQASKAKLEARKPNLNAGKPLNPQNIHKQISDAVFAHTGLEPKGALKGVLDDILPRKEVVGEEGLPPEFARIKGKGELSSTTREFLEQVREAEVLQGESSLNSQKLNSLYTRVSREMKEYPGSHSDGEYIALKRTKGILHESLRESLSAREFKKWQSWKPASEKQFNDLENPTVSPLAKIISAENPLQVVLAARGIGKVQAERLFREYGIDKDVFTSLVRLESAVEPTGGAQGFSAYATTGALAGILTTGNILGGLTGAATAAVGYPFIRGLLIRGRARWHARPTGPTGRMIRRDVSFPAETPESAATFRRQLNEGLLSPQDIANATEGLSAPEEALDILHAYQAGARPSPVPITGTRMARPEELTAPASESALRRQRARTSDVERAFEEFVRKTRQKTLPPPGEPIVGPIRTHRPRTGPPYPTPAKGPEFKSSTKYSRGGTGAITREFIGRAPKEPLPQESRLPTTARKQVPVSSEWEKFFGGTKRLGAKTPETASQATIPNPTPHGTNPRATREYYARARTRLSKEDRKRLNKFVQEELEKLRKKEAGE